MKKELQDKLYENYPKIFAQKDLTIRQSCMPWGICCNDGWYTLLDVLCGNIQHCIDYRLESIKYWDKAKEEGCCWKSPRPEPIPQLEAVQVKEKFGGLRFYFQGGNEYISGMITLTEAMSYYICEECGKPGKEVNVGWLFTLCPECHTEYKKKRNIQED